MGGSSSALARAEHELLSRGVEWWTRVSRAREVPSSPRPSPPLSSPPPVAFSLRDVPIGDGLHIHTAEYSPSEMEEERRSAGGGEQPPLVMMHGFGTGLGIYYAALPALAERWAGRILALDSLGCCLSSRPRWHLSKGASCPVPKAEEFFVEGIERWREKMKIDKMVGTLPHPMWKPLAFPPSLPRDRQSPLLSLNAQDSTLIHPREHCPLSLTSVS